MKTVAIVTQQPSKTQWMSWIDALAESGLGTIRIHRSRIGKLLRDVGPVDAFVVDGLLTRVAYIIMQIRAVRPHARIIVATARSSYSVYYTAMQLGASYVAQLDSPQHFSRVIHKAVSGSAGQVYLLPHWISHFETLEESPAHRHSHTQASLAESWEQASRLVLFPDQLPIGERVEAVASV